MLRITPEVRDQLFAHALSTVPLEACGMVSAVGDSDLVDLFHPIANAAQSASLFALDGQQMLDVEAQVHEAGRRIVGVMHSHTKTSAYPSTTDIEGSAAFDPSGVFAHVIVSLRAAEPVVRCYQIVHGEVTEVPVVVSADTDDDLFGDDDAPKAAVMRLAPPSPQ